MNTIELITILSRDKITKPNFIGVYASDHIRSLQVRKFPACFMVNTDPSWKSGAHWLAIYISHNNKVEFFDSYGQDPSKYPTVFDFLKRQTGGDVRMNTEQQLQSYFSSTCGQFCLYFLLWRCRGVTFEN